MLTPYNFSVNTSLRLSGKRILVHDSLTLAELKKLLGVVPSRMKSNNVPLSWLCESIPQCETMAKGARRGVQWLGSTDLLTWTRPNWRSTGGSESSLWLVTGWQRKKPNNSVRIRVPKYFTRKIRKDRFNYKKKYCTGFDITCQE